jgi:hypothetical protein
MGNQSRIPVKDADFNNYINIAIPYLSTNKTRLALTTASQANQTLASALLLTAGTGWNSLYPQSLNPATATTSIITAKINLRTQIEATIRAIYADIPKSVLTQVDRDTLNIPLVSDTRTPSVKPTSVPSLTVSERGHLSATINILDVVHSLSLSNVTDADAIDIEAAFLPLGATVSADFPQESDFHHVATLGKSICKRTYTADQIKGTEYLKACYLSSRSEAGGWSEVISVVVA